MKKRPPMMTWATPWRSMVAEVDGPQDTPCLVWQGSIRRNDGYGRRPVGKTGRSTLAHRSIYIEEVGPIPDGLVLDHLCRVRACVNPLHLEPVTQAINLHRGYSIQAMNAQKTHCKHGHPFDEENTYRTPKNERACRACRRARYAAAQHQKQEKAA